jgi:hypothetical protein
MGRSFLSNFGHDRPHSTAVKIQLLFQNREPIRPDQSDTSFMDVPRLIQTFSLSSELFLKKHSKKFEWKFMKPYNEWFYGLEIFSIQIWYFISWLRSLDSSIWRLRGKDRDHPTVPKHSSFQRWARKFPIICHFSFSRRSPIQLIRSILFFISVLVKRVTAKKKHLQNFSSKNIREIFNFLFSLVKKFAIFIEVDFNFWADLLGIEWEK